MSDELPFPKPRTEQEAQVLRDMLNEMVDAYLSSVMFTFKKERK
jgi:hypothetical protein